jgi:hypothetical protein
VNILPKRPTVKAPADTFTGDACYDFLIRGEEPSRIRVSVVRFAPGARNAWHAHAVRQTVHVTEGVGLTVSPGWYDRYGPSIVGTVVSGEGPGRRSDSCLASGPATGRRHGAAQCLCCVRRPERLA